MAKEKKKGITIKIPKNPWIISTLILLIILAISLIRGWGPTGMVTGVLTSEQAANRVIDYINNYLLEGQGTATVVSISEENDLYNLKLQIGGRTFDSYVTKDGRLLFPSAIDLTQTPETPETPEQQPQGAFDAPDREKPTVDLFVMSFCPFGVQTENIMKSVVDLLGTKIDMKIRFIANVQGDTVDSIRSLHGLNEAMEDLRQLCIMKYYDQETFWNYLMDINENCYPVYRDVGELESCWKSAATKAGIDTSEIETCVNTEGLNLMRADEQLADQYGVTGSPTLIINGQRYSGERTSESFKQAICSGFITQPSECSETLSTSGGGSPSGGC